MGIEDGLNRPQSDAKIRSDHSITHSELEDAFPYIEREGIYLYCYSVPEQKQPSWVYIDDGNGRAKPCANSEYEGFKHRPHKPR